MAEPISRRRVIAGAAAAGVAVFTGVGRGLPAVAVTGDGPSYLSEAELETLRGVVDVIVPADTDPGALVAGCADAIDALLGAFTADPPRIFAGAPFSDRAGSAIDHFEDFLPLDPYEQQGWRLRVEGSGGDPALEFNGPVPGYQQVYRDGLAACEAQAQGMGFSTLPPPLREAILRSGDEAITAMTDIAVPHTFEFLYGAPEYGGNEGLAGWDFTRWMGDVQPRGFTDEEVTEPDDPGPALPLPEGIPPLASVAGLGTAEHALQVAASGESRLSTAREIVRRAQAASVRFSEGR